MKRKQSKFEKHQEILVQLHVATEDLRYGDLRTRMQAAAKLAQLWMCNGGDGVFVAGIMGRHAPLVLIEEMTDTSREMQLKSHVIHEAYRTSADSLVVVYEGWEAPHDNEASRDSCPRPSLHPEREHVLVALGKDQWEDVCWMQPVHRSGSEFFFGEMMSLSVKESFLDEYRFLNQPVSEC